MIRLSVQIDGLPHGKYIATPSWKPDLYYPKTEGEWKYNIRRIWWGFIPSLFRVDWDVEQKWVQHRVERYHRDRYPLINRPPKPPSVSVEIN